MPQHSHDVLVIGEGVSGLTAAQALARTGLKVATFEAQLFGGLVLNVNELEPAPDAGTVGGAELASQLMQANGELGVESIQEEVIGIRNGGDLKKVETAGTSYDGRALVIASGARLRKLGVPGEAEFEGRGVSQCADCDGPMYQNEEVVVIGGGDSALQEALVLAKFCRKVHLVHRGARFRATPHFVEQVAGQPKITTVFNATAEMIEGSRMVEGVRVKHHDGRSETIACAGVFVYIGLAPNGDFLPEAIARDADGYVTTAATLETALPGVYAIGAVRSGYKGLLTDAIHEANRAAQAIRALLA
jgi:thioredoxin reductase (NADPH)